MQRTLKATSIVLLSALFITAVYFIFFTPVGRELRVKHALLGQDVRYLAARHPISAPLIFIAIYTALATLALPVWWVPILGGLVFGVWLGTVWSLIGAMLGAAIAFALVRWIAAEWFHQRVESKMERLKQIDEALGHNGFLVVIAVRLIHLMPFGLCNYALGLTEISLADVILGTLLGGIPTVSIYVAIGAGLHPLQNWRFITVIAILNVLMIVPIAARYWRPQWFRRIGVK
jgi:uncharacterized membrane protein YdjX (TVP38/TMEM64 family)